MSEIKEFKTESKRLLDLMINSIYTNKEIFLRELISNASDAIDKYHYLALKNSNIETIEHEIRIECDEKLRTITITDNGIGMDYDDIVNHLGTIAKSGSAEFLKKLNENDKTNEIEIIGQFGVGFYSAFMVAKKVIVESKSVSANKGLKERFIAENPGFEICIPSIKYCTDNAAMIAIAGYYQYQKYNACDGLDMNASASLDLESFYLNK